MPPIELKTWLFEVGELHEAYLAVSPSEALVACCELIRDRVTVWTLPVGDKLVTVEEDAGLDVCFSSQSDFLATCGVRAITVQPCDGSPPFKLLPLSNASFGEVARLRLSHDGLYLFAASASWLRVWELLTRKEVACVQFDNDEHMVDLFLNASSVTVFLKHRSANQPSAVAPQMKQSILLDTIPFRVKRYVIPCNGREVCFSMDGTVVAYCVDYLSGTYAIWHMAEPANVCQVALQSNMIHRFAISCDSKLMAQGYKTEGGVTIFDTRTGKLLNTIDTGVLPPQFLFSPTANLLAVATHDLDRQIDKVDFVDPLNGIVIGTAEGHPVLAETSHCFSPQGKWFISASTTQSIYYQACPLPSGTIIATDLAPITHRPG